MAEIIKRKLIYGFGALAVIAFVFALTMGLSFGKFGSSAKDVKLGATDPPIAQLPPAVEQLSNAFITVAHAVTPAVVQIRVTSTPKAVNVPNGQNAPEQYVQILSSDLISLFIISICLHRSRPQKKRLAPA